MPRATDARPDYWTRRRLVRGSSLPALHKLLLLVLMDYAGADGRAYPSQETLAQDLSLSDRHVRRIVRDLIAREIIEQTRRRQQSAIYLIDWNRLAELAQDRTPVSTLEKSRPDKIDHQDRTKSHVKTGHRCPPNQTKNQTKEQIPGRVRAGGGQKPEALRAEEFADLAAGHRRFRAAVEAGECRPEDEVRYLTLWRYTDRQAARTDAKRLRNPVGCFARWVRAGEWRGSDADEDAARAFLRDRARRANGHRHPLVAAAAADLQSDIDVGGIDDEL